MTGRTFTRTDLLTELADQIRELTEPRTATTYRETTKIDGTKRTRIRQPHTVKMPSLMQSLELALQPGSNGEPIGPANFESRPSADLEALRVLTLIRDETAGWAAALKVDPAPMSRLVSAPHTDSQLGQLTGDACRWVKLAREATGWDPAPFTLNQPCPYCWARNQIVVTGDLETARCGRCKTAWDHDTIGLLGQMLNQNTEHETLAAGRCQAVSALDDCYLVEGHFGEHRGNTGRYWRAVTCA